MLEKCSYQRCTVQCPLAVWTLYFYMVLKLHRVCLPSTQNTSQQIITFFICATLALPKSYIPTCSILNINFLFCKIMIHKIIYKVHFQEFFSGINNKNLKRKKKSQLFKTFRGSHRNPLWAVSFVKNAARSTLTSVTKAAEILKCLITGAQSRCWKLSLHWFTSQLATSYFIPEVTRSKRCLSIMKLVPNVFLWDLSTLGQMFSCVL